MIGKGNAALAKEIVSRVTEKTVGIVCAIQFESGDTKTLVLGELIMINGLAKLIGAAVDRTSEPDNLVTNEKSH